MPTEHQTTSTKISHYRRIFPQRMFPSTFQEAVCIRSGGSSITWIKNSTNFSVDILPGTRGDQRRCRIGPRSRVQRASFSPSSVVAGHQELDRLQHKALRREGVPNDTPFVVIPLTAELVVAKREILQIRQFAEGRRS